MSISPETNRWNKFALKSAQIAEIMDMIKDNKFEKRICGILEIKPDELYDAIYEVISKMHPYVEE